MHKLPFIKITETGTAFLSERPPGANGKPDFNQPEYDKRPVQIAVRHDLSIEMHGENFSVSKRVSPDEALSLILMLTYQLRETQYLANLPATQFVESPRK